MTDAFIKADAIDALLAPFDRSNAPGFAVGIALGGKPGYRRGVGMASIELPVVLSPTMRMRIGSTSKHFTVLAVMLLAEEGLLSIEDSPRRLLPELPQWAEAFSIRQLMAHTSGMRDSLDLVLHSAGPSITGPADFQLKLLAGLDSVNFAPGESWSYNNSGYVLLAEIVERVSGKTFADFLKSRIFEPVGMIDTLVRPLDTDLIPNSATLHVARPDGGYDRGVFGLPIGGEGGMVSTIDDMLLWLRHMSAPVVGTRETWQAMRTPVSKNGYGLGLSQDRYRGLTTLHHAGAVVGGSCQMLKVLEHELDIIVMTNGLGSLAVHDLVEKIIDTCIPDLPDKPRNVPADVLAGIFYSAETGRRLALENSEGAQAIRIDGMTLPAHRDAQGQLSVPLVSKDMRITPHADGGALDLYELEKQDVLRRLEPPAHPGFEILAGCYENAGASVRAEIELDGEGGAVMTLANPLGNTRYTLNAIGPDLWEARATGALPLAIMLEWRDGDLDMTSGRTRRLRLKRVL